MPSERYLGCGSGCTPVMINSGAAVFKGSQLPGLCVRTPEASMDVLKCSDCRGRTAGVIIRHTTYYTMRFKSGPGLQTLGKMHRAHDHDL